MHGIAGSATAHFLGDNMGEPSLSRMHKIVETAINEAELVVNDQLLISARLLCYYSGELLASSRLHCCLETNDLGLDKKLCRQLLDKAENLALSTECVILEIRRARVALSKLFKWFRDRQVNVDKRSDATEKSDYKYITGLVEDEQPIHSSCFFSKTEALLNLQVMRLLSKPCEPNVSVSRGCTTAPNCSQLERISRQIRDLVEQGKHKVAEFSTGRRFPLVEREIFSDKQSFALHERLRSARTKSRNTLCGNWYLKAIVINLPSLWLLNPVSG